MSAADASHRYGGNKRGKGTPAAIALEVDAATAAGNVSVRECVRHAVSDYFRSLGGEPCSDLYSTVLSQVEAPLFEVVMRECAGNCTQAAAILGVSRATLRARLKKYDLD